MVKAKPIFFSLAYAFINIIMMSLATEVVKIIEPSIIGNHLITSIFVYASAGIALLIMWIKPEMLHEYGLCMPEKSRINFDTSLYFIPLLVVELFPFIAGVSREMTLSKMLSIILLTLGIGINEELFFRGLILQEYRYLGRDKAIIISSVFFGVAHLTNVIAGGDIFSTLLQVIFAALFGLVAGQLVFLTHSILPAILWHFLHDMVTISTAVIPRRISGFIILIQVITMLIYSMYIGTQIEKLDNK